MNYYIADTHFGHVNIISLDKRPFKDADEMWEKMKELWNTRVKDTDDVWIIGDFCFRSGKKPGYYLKQLKGKKHLIIGNHENYLKIKMQDNILNQLIIIKKYMIKAKLLLCVTIQ